MLTASSILSCLSLDSMQRGNFPPGRIASSRLQPVTGWPSSYPLQTTENLLPNSSHPVVCVHLFFLRFLAVYPFFVNMTGRENSYFSSSTLWRHGRGTASMGR